MASRIQGVFSGSNHLSSVCSWPVLLSTGPSLSPSSYRRQMAAHEASWSAPSWLLLFSPSPSRLPGLPPGSDLLRVTSASVTSATVIQIRIHQQSWETFPGLKCSEACDSRIQGCATSETNTVTSKRLCCFVRPGKPMISPVLLDFTKSSVWEWFYAKIF